MSTLSLVGLAKRYGQQTVVDQLTLHVHDREFVALLGPSGCGKTTTLRLIAGFLEPDEGRVEVGGRVLSESGAVVPPEQRDMSMVFQSYALWPHMTVAENVAYGLRYRGVRGQAARRKVGEALAMVKLEEAAARYPAELSGGQQQRVALARALAVQPGMLLLDEPLSNLDAGLREEMRGEIRRLHDLIGVTTVYVTHDQVEALALADRVALLNRGRLEQIGTPEEVYERPASHFVATFVGHSNLLSGVMTGDGRVALEGGSAELSVAHLEGAPPGARVQISIRPHVIDLLPGGAGNGQANVVTGRIVAHSYTGDRREYRVALDSDGRVLRVHARPRLRYPVGDMVCVRLDPEECYVIATNTDTGSSR
jgi:iron(III) transport system ATP-binding protein